MISDGVLLIKINNKTLESAEQDQTARMCRLIWLYTVRNIIHGYKREDMVTKQIFSENSESKSVYNCVKNILMVTCHTVVGYPFDQ